MNHWNSARPGCQASTANPALPDEFFPCPLIRDLARAVAWVELESFKRPDATLSGRLEARKVLDNTSREWEADSAPLNAYLKGGWR
jgi:hypothetical protein